MEMTIFYAFVCTYLGEIKSFHPKNDGIRRIYTILDSKSPKVLFKSSDSSREGKNFNIVYKWQAPPMVVEAEVHENYYAEIETDSEESDNEVSDEDPVLDRKIALSQETSSNALLSYFSVYESKSTLKLATDILDCDNILVNQENASVLNTGHSRLSNSKLSTRDVESPQCKGLLGCANPFEKLFVDKETQLVCRKIKHSQKQICSPRTCFIEAFNAANDHRLSRRPGFEKTLLCLKRFS